MSTATAEQATQPTNQIQKTELQTFLAIKSEISAFAAQYGALTISGIDDKLGSERVYAARMLVKKKRIQVEKRGKELRDEANKTAKAVLAAERELVGLLEPVETHLKDEEDRIEKLKEEIRREEARKIEAKIQDRVAQMVKLGLTPNLATVRDASDQDFADYMETQGQLHQEKLKKEQQERDRQAEVNRIAAEQRARDDARRKKEQDDLRAEKERLDGIRKQQEVENLRLAAEKRRLEIAERDRLAALKPVAVAPPERLIPVEPNIPPHSPAVASIASVAVTPVSRQTAFVSARPPAPSPAPNPIRGALLAYAEKVKTSNPPSCSDELKGTIQEILQKCGREIEEAVKIYFA